MTTSHGPEGPADRLGGAAVRGGHGRRPSGRSLRGLAGLAAALLVGVLGTTPAAAASRGPVVLPIGSHPHGQSYAEWSADWWTWALAQPAATNPILDDTGAQCANDQAGPVWFLAGAVADGVSRSCAIPTGKGIYVPIINLVYCAYPDDPPETRTEEFVRGLVDPAVENATNLHAAVDGRAITGVDAFLVHSALFSGTLGPDNVFGAPDGQVIDPCADAGYYVLLPPLPAGSHTLSFGGTLPDYDFTVSVSYALTVG